MLKAAKLFLESQYAFEVTSAASGHDALALFHTGKYHAVVSGYDIPGINGLNLLSAIRTSGSDIPFIVFTEKNREDVVIEALNTGADFYLQKGGNTKALYTQLANQIQQAVRRRSAENAIIQKKKDLRHLIDASPNPAMLLNARGEIIAINQSAIRSVKHFNEISEEDIYGKNAFDLFPAEITHEKLAAIEQAVATGEVITSEMHFRDRIYECYIAPRFDENHNLHHIAYFQQDVTELKRTHEVLIIQRDLGFILTEVESLDEVCIPCLDAAISVAGMDSGMIHLLDDTTEDLVYYHSANLSSDLCNSVFRIGAGADLVRVLKSGKCVFSTPEAFGHAFSEGVKQEGLTAIVTIPVFFMGGLIGGISIASHATDFTPDCQHEALEIIAAMGGNTIGRLMAESLLDEETLGLIPAGFTLDESEEELTGHSQREENLINPGRPGREIPGQRSGSTY